jgi:hypothetical protein
MQQRHDHSDDADKDSDNPDRNGGNGGVEGPFGIANGFRLLVCATLSLVAEPSKSKLALWFRKNSGAKRVRRLLFAKPLKFGAPFGFLFRIGHGSASLKIATAFATQLGSTGQYGTTRKPYPDIELCPKNRTN